jgi:hypothetical protein
LQLEIEQVFSQLLLVEVVALALTFHTVVLLEAPNL